MRYYKMEKRTLFIRYWYLLGLSLIWSNLLFAQNVKNVGITVSNIETIVPFYTDILAFKLEKTYTLEGDALQRLTGLNEDQLKLRVAILGIGSERIELWEFINEKETRVIPADSKSNDLWFQHIAIVVNDMEKAYQKIWDNKVTHVSTAPQTLPDYITAAAGIKAFYFRDPDGHNLEFIYFPKDKGNPKWQKTTEKTILGIDHTAIGISNTTQSQQFYEDCLNLKVAGNSENYGPEQEHLNQVFGARLWITGLKGKNGFGVEFLEYIAPPGGRLYPKDSQLTDLWHWHTTIEVKDIETTYRKIQEKNYQVISSGIIDLSTTSIGYQKGFLARDPDGHAVLIVQ